MAENRKQREPEQAQGWVDCPPEALLQLSHALRAKQTRRQMMQGSLIAGALLMLGGGLWWAFREEEPTGVGHNYAGISCREVMRVLHHTRDGTCPGGVNWEQIRQHLAQCPYCGPKAKAMGVSLNG